MRVGPMTPRVPSGLLRRCRRRYAVAGGDDGEVGELGDGGLGADEDADALGLLRAVEQLGQHALLLEAAEERLHLLDLARIAGGDVLEQARLAARR